MTLRMVSVALFSVGAMALSGCVDKDNAHLSGYADRVALDDVRLTKMDDAAMFAVDGNSYRMIVPPQVGENIIASVSNMVGSVFRGTHPDEKVAIECALSHYGGAVEAASLGMDSLDGYQMALCTFGAFNGRVLYLPNGVWEDIQSALKSMGDKMSSENWLGDNATIIFLGHAIQPSLLQIGQSWTGMHPIVVEHWAPSGRTYDIWQSAGDYLKLVWQAADAGMKLSGVLPVQ